MLLLFYSHVFLRVQSVHGVAARSVFLGVPSVHGKALALLHPRSRSLAGSERYSPSGGDSRRLPSYSLAGVAKYLVLSLSTRSFLGQTHSRAGQSPHRSTTCSFPLPRARAAVFPPQGVAAMRRYPHDHDRLWLPGQTVHSPGSQSTARGSMCHHCRWCAVVGQWRHLVQARDGSSMIPRATPFMAFSSPRDRSREPCRPACLAQVKRANEVSFFVRSVSAPPVFKRSRPPGKPEYQQLPVWSP